MKNHICEHWSFMAFNRIIKNMNDKTGFLPRKFFIVLFATCFSYPIYINAQISTKGIASYYAEKFHGRTMSNGDKYHRDSMTCAHLKYPFGTKLLVRNIRNGKEVIVTVTDRGPYTKRFIIDLSRAAAEKLDYIQQGICKVEITPYIENQIPLRLEVLEDRDTIAPHVYPSVVTYPNPEWKSDSTATRQIQETPVNSQQK